MTKLLEPNISRKNTRIPRCLFLGEWRELLQQKTTVQWSCFRGLLQERNLWNQTVQLVNKPNVFCASRGLSSTCFSIERPGCEMTMFWLGKHTFWGSCGVDVHWHVPISSVSPTQPDSHISKSTYLYRITEQPFWFWSCILSVGERFRSLFIGDTSHTWPLSNRHIWTLSRAVLSPVEGLSDSMPHLPLTDSRCPAGLWTMSAWDVPNVHQLPGRQLMASHQRQAKTYK